MATKEMNNNILNKLPKKSRIPKPQDSKPASSKVRPAPNFNRLHQKWSSKLQQGKAMQKKPCTVVHEFDLTRSETKFTKVSEKVVQSTAASAVKLSNFSTENDFTHRPSQRNSKSKRNLFPDPLSETQLCDFNGIDSDKENEDPEDRVVDPNRESFSTLVKNQNDLNFEADVEALNSILNNQGINHIGAVNKKTSTRAAFRNTCNFTPTSAVASNHDNTKTPKNSTLQRPRNGLSMSARRSIYYNGLADGVSRTSVYSEQKRQAISRLTVDGGGVSSPLVMGKIEVFDKRPLNRHYLPVSEILSMAANKNQPQTTPNATQARRVPKVSDVDVTIDNRPSLQKARRVPMTFPRQAAVSRRNASSIYLSTKVDPLAKFIQFDDHSTKTQIESDIKRLQEIEEQEALLSKEIFDMVENEEKDQLLISRSSLSPKEIKDRSNQNRKRVSLESGDNVAIVQTPTKNNSYTTPVKTPAFSVFEDSEKFQIPKAELKDSSQKKTPLGVLSPNVQSPGVQGKLPTPLKLAGPPAMQVMKQTETTMKQYSSATAPIVRSPANAIYDVLHTKERSPYISCDKENKSPYIGKLDDSICALDIHNCTLDDLNVTLSESIIQFETLENQMYKLNSKRKKKETNGGDILRQLELVQQKQQKLMRLQHKLQQQLAKQELNVVDEEETAKKAKHDVVQKNNDTCDIKKPEEKKTDNNEKQAENNVGTEIIIKEVAKECFIEKQIGVMPLLPVITSTECKHDLMKESSSLFNVSETQSLITTTTPSEPQSLIKPVTPSELQSLITPVTPPTCDCDIYAIHTSPDMSVSMLKDSLADYLPEELLSPHDESATLEELGERILHDMGHYDDANTPSPVRPAMPDLVALNRVASQLVGLAPYSPHKPMLGIFHHSPSKPLFAGSAQLLHGNHKLTSPDRHLSENQPHLDISGSTISSGTSSCTSSNNVTPESLTLAPSCLSSIPYSQHIDCIKSSLPIDIYSPGSCEKMQKSVVCEMSHVDSSRVRKIDDNVGSLSLISNLVRPKTGSTAPVDLHNCVLSMAAERFWDALLDDEVSLYAGRLFPNPTVNSPFVKERCNNPVATSLTDGDDQHFIPVQQGCCILNQIDDSASSPPKQL